MTSKARLTAFGAVALVFAFGVSMSAQLPKTGTAKLHSGWKLVGEMREVGKDSSVLGSTAYGVWFNDENKGFLHQAYWICSSAIVIADGRAIEDGHCTATDTDGDQIWTAARAQGPQDGLDIVGTHAVKGGSGKYAGIEGSITYRCKVLGKYFQAACTHEASYRLP